MKHFKPEIYEKLLLQAQEAKYCNLEKLASAIIESIGPYPEQLVSYSFEELDSDIYKGLWKLAGNIIKYNNLNNVDIQKIDLLLESFAEKFIDELNTTLKINKVSEIEPKVPGQY